MLVEKIVSVLATERIILTVLCKVFETALFGNLKFYSDVFIRLQFA